MAAISCLGHINPIGHENLDDGDQHHHHHDHHDHYAHTLLLQSAEDAVRLAVATGNTSRCGTADVSEDTKLAIESHLRPYLVPNLRGKEAADFMSVASTVTVPVYFHVITSSSGSGSVSSTQINNQINVLNSAYSRAGFRFVLKGNLHSNPYIYIPWTTSYCIAIDT
ncbi:hypothetical protein EON65_27865 [archaeon]|nr:MAG: hypothetical protein EON65_27865 [archaeon]